MMRYRPQKIKRRGDEQVFRTYGAFSTPHGAPPEAVHHAASPLNFGRILSLLRGDGFTRSAHAEVQRDILDASHRVRVEVIGARLPHGFIAHADGVFIPGVAAFERERHEWIRRDHTIAPDVQPVL